MKLIEKVKNLARKAFGIRITQKTDGIKYNIIQKLLIVSDIFLKLKKEFDDCIADINAEKTITVFVKNFKETLNRKFNSFQKLNEIVKLLETEIGKYKYLNLLQTEEQKSNNNNIIIHLLILKK